MPVSSFDPDFVTRPAPARGSRRWISRAASLLAVGLTLLPTAAFAQQAEPPPPPPPTAAAPEQAPPPPPEELPAPPPGISEPPESAAPPAASSAPIDRSEPAPGVAGQWVYTSQYGWVWMPYGQSYTYVPNDGYPAMYLYGPTLGWRWVAAPWVLGWGPAPYWGVRGRAHFVWYSHPWFAHRAYRGSYFAGHAHASRGGGYGHFHHHR